MRHAEDASSGLFSASPSIDVARWYALYTYPRHEKVVTEHLGSQRIESFLPSRVVMSRWKDRQVPISRAIFPCYVFARLELRNKLKVVSIPSVIRIVSCKGVPVPIPDQELEAVRLCLSKGGEVEKHSFLEVGERVRVCSGAFEGLEGIVLRHNNGCKLVVSISLIYQAIALEIDASQLEPIDARVTSPPPTQQRQHLQ